MELNSFIFAAPKRPIDISKINDTLIWVPVYTSEANIDTVSLLNRMSRIDNYCSSSTDLGAKKNEGQISSGLKSRMKNRNSFNLNRSNYSFKENSYNGSSRGNLLGPKANFSVVSQGRPDSNPNEKMHQEPRACGLLKVEVVRSISVTRPSISFKPKPKNPNSKDTEDKPTVPSPMMVSETKKYKIQIPKRNLISTPIEKKEQLANQRKALTRCLFLRKKENTVDGKESKDSFSRDFSECNSRRRQGSSELMRDRILKLSNVTFKREPKDLNNRTKVMNFQANNSSILKKKPETKLAFHETFKIPAPISSKVNSKLSESMIVQDVYRKEIDNIRHRIESHNPKSNSKEADKDQDQDSIDENVTTNKCSRNQMVGNFATRKFSENGASESTVTDRKKESGLNMQYSCSEIPNEAIPNLKGLNFNMEGLSSEPLAQKVPLVIPHQSQRMQTTHPVRVHKSNALVPPSHMIPCLFFKSNPVAPFSCNMLSSHVIVYLHGNAEDLEESCYLVGMLSARLNVAESDPDEHHCDGVPRVRSLQVQGAE